MNQSYFKKFANFLYFFSIANDEKKKKILEHLDKVSRIDVDFQKIKENLFETQESLWSNLFGVIKKNPNISLDNFIKEKEKLELEKAKKEQGQALKFTEEEIALVSHLPDKLKSWALNSLRLSGILRPFFKNISDDLLNKLNKIMHYAAEHPEIDFNSKFPGPHGIQNAFKDAEEWENSFKETDVKNYITNNVVFTDGSWKIVEIKGTEEQVSNDLQMESKILNHCVKDYVDEVMENECRIFSLRDSSNKPHVTIETDSEIYDFRQEYGIRNSTPTQEEQDIIDKWKESLHPESQILEELNKIQYKEVRDYNFVSFINSKNSLSNQSINEILNYFDNNLKVGNEIDNSFIINLCKNKNLTESQYKKIFELIINIDNTDIMNNCLENLASNQKIPISIILMILNLNYNNYIFENICGNIVIGNNDELVHKLFNIGSIDNKIELLNNNSIKSRTIIEFLKNEFDIIYRFEYYSYPSDKTVDDILNTARILKDKSLKFILFINKFKDVIKEETLKKYKNAVGITDFSDIISNNLNIKKEFSNYINYDIYKNENLSYNKFENDDYRKFYSKYIDKNELIDYFNQSSFSVKINLLQNSKIVQYFDYDYFVKIFKTKREINLYILNNNFAPTSLINYIYSNFDNYDSNTISILVSNENTDINILYSIYKYIENFDKYSKNLILNNILSNPNIDDYLFRKILSEIEPDNLYFKFLCNPSIPIDILFNFDQIFDNTQAFSVIDFISKNPIILQNKQLFEKVKNYAKKHDLIINLSLNPGIFENINKASSIFDLPTYQDKPRSLQTVIPEEDKNLVRPKEPFFMSTFPLEDFNQAVDSNIVSIKKFLQYNPFGQKYNGNFDDVIDLKLISIIKELEQKVQEKLGEPLKILSGNSIDNPNFFLAIKILKDPNFKKEEKSDTSSKIREGVTTVESPNKPSISKPADSTIIAFQKILGVEPTGVIDPDTIMAAEAVELKISKLTNKDTSGMLLDQRLGKFKTTTDDLIEALNLIKTTKKSSKFEKSIKYGLFYMNNLLDS